MAQPPARSIRARGDAQLNYLDHRLEDAPPALENSAPWGGRVGMAGQDGQEALGKRSEKIRGASTVRHRRVAGGPRLGPLPGLPDEDIAQDGAPREVEPRFCEAFATWPRRFEAALRIRRPAPEGSQAVPEPTAAAKPPTGLGREPSAAVDRRDRVAAIDRRHVHARPNCFEMV